MVHSVSVMIINKIKKILVPFDGSKNSLRGIDMAISLARQCDASIVGIYVISTPPHSEFRGVGSVRKSLQEGVEKFMDLAKTKAAQNGILFKERIVHGNVGYNIVSYAQAKKNHIDLIVIGSRGMGAAKELFLGSTSNYVLHKSPIPVLIVK